MRYLTHDAEDSFWEAQGVKPHPLAAREAAWREEQRKKPPIHSYQNVTIPISEPSSQTNSSSPGSSPAGSRVVSNGTAAVRPTSHHEELVPPADDRRYSSSSTLRSGESTPPSKRGDTMNMSDEEVIVSEEHAKRVGYKVSAV